MRSTTLFSVRSLLVFCMAVVTVVVPPSPARAEDNITCAYEDTITTTPGIGHAAGYYGFESETRATLTCFGMLGDVMVAGTGWFFEKGYGYGTCLQAEGSIDIVGELPTADGGILEVTGHLWAKRTGLTGTATGFINGVLMTGPYVGHPSATSTRPNCDAPPPVSKGTVVKGFAVSVPRQDTVVPPTPVDLAAEQDGARVHLSWAPGEGDPTLPVTGYRVYRDGEALEIEKGLVQATSYIDSSADAGTHTYTVVAVNDTGVESELAGPITITTAVGQPWVAQTFDPVMSPTHVKTKASKSIRSDVDLRWKEPAAGQPEFYRIYSTRDPFQPLATVSDASYVDADVDFSCAGSFTYYVTAVDTGGTEAWSEPVEVGPFTESDASCP